VLDHRLAVRVAAVNNSTIWRRILVCHPGAFAGDGAKDKPDVALFLAEALSSLRAFSSPRGRAVITVAWGSLARVLMVPPRLSLPVSLISSLH